MVRHSVMTSEFRETTLYHPFNGAAEPICPPPQQRGLTNTRQAIQENLIRPALPYRRHSVKIAQEAKHCTQNKKHLLAFLERDRDVVRTTVEQPLFEKVGSLRKPRQTMVVTAFSLSLVFREYITPVTQTRVNGTRRRRRLLL